MKLIYFFAILIVTFSCCDTPKSITANPSNQSNTSGTLGSAKMTNELPLKTDTSTVKQDSIRLNH
ncbi:MAG: hypothetical protein WKF89_17190 [Chitinophagaceae bacterium]